MLEKRPLLGDDAVIDVAEYRRTLGAFLTGVTIITTRDVEGLNRGITANSFTSVSLDPPLVLFCIDRSAASYQTFMETAGFVIHILGSDQQELARTFASKSPNKFEDLRYSQSSTGAAIIDDVHAWMDCTTESVIVAGDHAVIIGRVRDYSAQDRRPLGFYQGKFQSFNTEHELSLRSGDQSAALTVGWMLETQDGRLALGVRTDGSYSVPQTTLTANAMSDEGLSTAASMFFGVDAVIDFLYSVYDTANAGMTFVYRGRLSGDQASLETLNEKGIVLVPVDSIEGDRITQRSERAAVERYVTERVEARFGVYAGNQLDGSIATIASVVRDTRNQGQPIGKE